MDMNRRDASSNKANQIKMEIKNMLSKHGSLELIAHFVVKEMLARRDADPSNLWSELPIVPYLLGLFLSSNNLKAGKPHYDQIVKLEKLLLSYFDFYQVSSMHLTSNKKPTHFIKFRTHLQKIMNDVDPKSYPKQKDKYYQMLTEFNSFFVAKHGFTVENAQKFAYIITFYTNTIFHKIDSGRKVTNLMGELIIKTDNFCHKYNIKEKNEFKRFMNTFSCQLGTLQSDIDPMSDNVINQKPIIKMENQSYFITRHELDRNLDDMLVSLLEKQCKQNSPDISNKFYMLRSKYLEDSVYTCFNKIFPGQLFRNAHFIFKNKKFETDLLIKCDDKILVVESKSSDVHWPAIQRSLRRLKNNLGKLSQDGMTQGINTRNYIKSQDTAIFWKDKAQSNVLVEIDSTKIKECFIIVVTLAQLGSIATTPDCLKTIGFFANNEYPWLVNLYDLDVITEWLNTPQDFTDYLEKRMYAQQQNIEAPSELILLGYYIREGNLPSDSTDATILDSNLMRIFDDYYLGRQNWFV